MKDQEVISTMQAADQVTIKLEVARGRLQSIVDEAGAVLIRAVQPVRGMTEMKKRRRIEQIRDLCNGPAKLTQAFAISSTLNGHDLTLGERLYITESSHAEPLSIKIGTRIGIRMGGEKLWRFFVEDNPCVSRR